VHASLGLFPRAVFELSPIYTIHLCKPLLPCSGKALECQDARDYLRG
jgi:hypothetical protein